MSTSHVLRLDEYRGRREQRLRQTLALYSADESRACVLRHLWRALNVAMGDRAAAVWVDEYGSGMVHTFAVLDLGADTPRRSFPLDALKLTWKAGVPGIVDMPDVERTGTVPIHGSARSACITSLGSDGMRAWFLIVDATAPRAALTTDAVERLMFLSGECAGVLLHRDLDQAGDARPGRFPGWSVLRDIDGAEDDENLNRRISGRFLVGRAVRSLVEDDLTIDRPRMIEAVQGVREELGHKLAGDPEREIWDRILQALEAEDLVELCGGVQALGLFVERMGHLSGAEEFHALAYELARHLGATDRAVDAARFLGRVIRRQARWDEAMRWYGVAREVVRTGEDPGRHALVLDGMAAVHIGRGALPRAREALDEAVELALVSEDRLAIASVHHNLMTVEHTAGRLQEAARFGWRAAQEAPDEEIRLRALTALGGVFLEGRALGAAEDAFAIVAARTTERYYLLHALEGYAHVAALRGDRQAYEQRLQRVERAGFAEGSPEYRAEAFLQRGDGYLHLDDVERARALYRTAIRVSSQFGVNEYLVRAEEALARLDRVEELDAHEAASAALVLPPSRELDEIRGGLDRIRRGVPALTEA